MIHKTTRSILSVLLAALLLVTSTPLTPAFAGEEGAVSQQSESGEGRVLTGDGTEEDPYKIATADDLLEFADKVNNQGKTDAWAELTADIDLNPDMKISEDGTVTGNPDPWTPIGTDINPYRGTFDGNGHTISGLYINDSSDNYQGLFGYVGSSGKVQNLSVSGNVSGSNSVGGVVGLNSGNVENCYNTGEVSGNNYVGGVVGYNSGNVENCYNTGKVSGPDSGSGNSVGGVVGWNLSSGNVENCYNTDSVNVSGSSVGGVVGLNHGSVENCYNTGEVSATSNVGGVVGYNINSTVENCYNIGEVSGGEDVGGVVGYNYSGSVTTCYNTGEVSGNSYVGGVVGRNESGGTVKNCYNIGEVSGNRNVGGVVGDNRGGGTVTGCYFLQQESEISGIGGGSPTTGATAVNDLSDQNQFKDWDFADTWRISTDKKRPVLQANAEDNALSGTGKQEDPYKIYRAIDLKNFRDLVNDGGAGASAHAKLMNNIDLSSVCSAEKSSWIPIGSISNKYTGNFNGDGHKIENLYINTTDSGADNQGLFGYVGGFVGSEGTVQNLTVEGSVSSTVANSNVGGVVGYNNGGTVTGCIFSGSGSVSVTGGNSVGGVVGYNSASASVTNCYNTGNISGDISIGFSGGVVGWNDSGTVKNCYNTGNISGNTSGGVVGCNSGIVENCYNTDSVSGDWYVGGVVGWNDSGTVKNCYNIGDVSGKISVGGVVGLNNGANVTNCYFLQTADVNVGRPGIGGGSGTSSNVEARTADAFHSGEVAYLLQNGQKAAEGGVVPLVWGQSKLGETTSLPTLNPTDEQKVYQVTFDYGDSFTETDDRYDYHYANANDNVTLPTSTDQIPEYEGHTLTGWQNEDGQAVTEPITVTADITFTAQWTKDTVNYTVTVTTSPAEGGTVNGGGTFAEGTQVTVTATANDGYTFVAWQEDGEKIEGAGASYTFTVNDNCTLTAIFEKEPDPTPIPTPTPDPKPSGPSTGDSSGWDDIRDELENAENGDQITIDMGDETKVPAEIFESLAGKDVEISFDLGDIQWSASGADIPTDTDFTDLDLGVDLDTHGIPANVINTITGEVGTVQITLAHNGEFGFTMTLSAPLGEENAGYWANLYHYDEEAEKLNFEAAAEIDEDGNVKIPFTHASQYAIVIDTHSHATVPVSDLFIDVAPDAWYKDAVQYAYDNGLMTGVSDTEFAPEATTTRAMIVSILARLEGVESAEAAGFADVDDEWYATAVNWAANVGVVNGYEDNTFKPNTAITREQLAAILMNYAAYKGYDVSARADLSHYSDADSISSWANDVLLWAVAEGLLTGVTDDTIAPQAHATRAQVAAILQRFLSE